MNIEEYHLTNDLVDTKTTDYFGEEQHDAAFNFIINKKNKQILL